MSLHDITYSSGAMGFENRRRHEDAFDYPALLAAGLEACDSICSHMDAPLEAPDTSDDFESLRWFPYPSDVTS